VNNLKQITIAMQNYESNYKTFPISTGWGNNFGGAYYFSDKVALLPYLERGEQGLIDPMQGSYSPGWSGQNAEAFSGRLPVFNCPSNANELQGGISNHTYSINGGTTHQPPHNGTNSPYAGEGRHNGVAAYRTEWGGSGPPDDPVVKMSSVQDGTSNTAAYSEFVIEQWYGNAPATDRRKLRAQVFSWASGTSTSEVRQSCLNQTAMNDAGGGRVMRGVSWSWAFIAVGGAYSHTMMPNEKSCHSWEGDWFGSNLMTANSEHPGGVNVGMVDGSVDFVNEDVASDVWWALGTRNGGESQSN
jgi:prepilin-type processing-associated H-X9-DG protein